MSTNTTCSNYELTASSHLVSSKFSFVLIHPNHFSYVHPPPRSIIHPSQSSILLIHPCPLWDISQTYLRYDAFSFSSQVNIATQRYRTYRRQASCGKFSFSCVGGWCDSREEHACQDPANDSVRWNNRKICGRKIPTIKRV